MRVRDALGPLFADVDFTTGALAGMFSGLGQPGLSPALLLMVVILQLRRNLSDREAVEAVADRTSWKYALSMELTDPGFDHTVLSEFRGRLAEQGCADAVLDLMLGTISVLALNATVAAWTEADEWLADTVSYLDANRRLVLDTVAAELPGIRHHQPEATYLAWLDCAGLRLPADPATVFRDLGRIELSPGPDFNPGGTGFARLNFATSRSVVRTLLDRIVLSTRLLEASC